MIRVAIVGAGYGGYGLAPAFRRAGAEVVALCAPSGERRDRVARSLAIATTASSLDELLALTPVDAVAIAVPPIHQPALAIAALERGLPVFAEKPLGANLGDVERMAAVAASHGLPTAVGFIFPEIAAWREARRLIAAGAIGRLRHVAISWLFESSDHRQGLSGWKTDPAQGGGALRHFGSHLVHNIAWLIGPTARIAGTWSGCPGRRGDTLVSLQAMGDGGVTAAALLCSAATQGDGHRIYIFGDDGAITLRNATPDPVDFVLSIRRRGVRDVESPAVPDDAPRVDGEDPRVAPIARLASRFLAAIAGGAPMSPGFAEGLHAQRAIEAIGPLSP